MQTDVVAMIQLIASQLIISLIFFVISMRIGRLALALVDEKIESTVNQMYERVDEKIQITVDEVAGVLGEIFEKPIVKKGMSIIGSQGGTATANKALTNQIALDVLNGPKFAGLKLVAEGLGMNLDEYIEGHGAVNTLNSIQSLSGFIPGMNLEKLLQGGPNLAVGSEANGVNYYLGGR